MKLIVVDVLLNFGKTPVKARFNVFVLETNSYTVERLRKQKSSFYSKHILKRLRLMLLKRAKENVKEKK